MSHFLSKEFRKLVLAIGFFTRIPIPVFSDFQENELNDSAKYFPLVGILVGLLGALVYGVTLYLLPSTVAILVSMAATIYLTGAFHEDGLADSADGLGGGWNKAQILAIMEDSRLGSYGAIALWMTLFFKFYLLSALPLAFIGYALVIAHAASRLAAVYLMASLTYVKPSGKSKPLANRIKTLDLLLATLFGCIPLAGLLSADLRLQFQIDQPFVLLMGAGLLSVLVWTWWRYKLKRWIGGYTGDCLGATQQMVELAIYAGFVMYFKLITV